MSNLVSSFRTTFARQGVLTGQAHDLLACTERRGRVSRFERKEAKKER